MGEAPDYDAEFAQGLIGRTMLVGLDYVNLDGRLLERRQVFGTVTGSDPESGIVIVSDIDGEAFTVAPFTAGITPAEPGEYYLKSEDRFIEDPDFVATFEIMRRPPQ